LARPDKVTLSVVSQDTTWLKDIQQELKGPGSAWSFARELADKPTFVWWQGRPAEGNALLEKAGTSMWTAAEEKSAQTILRKALQDRIKAEELQAAKESHFCFNQLNEHDAYVTGLQQYWNSVFKSPIKLVQLTGYYEIPVDVAKATFTTEK